MKNCIEYAKLCLESEIDFENEFLVDDTLNFINDVKIQDIRDLEDNDNELDGNEETDIELDGNAETNLIEPKVPLKNLFNLYYFCCFQHISYINFF